MTLGVPARILGVAAFVSTLSGCLRPEAENPRAIVVGITTDPNNLDPRFGLDEVSQRIQELVFDSLLVLDDRLRPAPWLAERIDHPDQLTYVVSIRRGVRFHDGHELTSADVVHTFRSLADPALAAPRGGPFRALASVDARDRYTAIFTLKEPYTSFPINFVMPIVPEGAGPSFRDAPIGTGPYRFARHAVDDRVELVPFAGYWNGVPRNEGLVFKVVPDEVMRGLELRNGTLDVVINDISPDILHQLQRDPALASSTGPGADYQYMGVNLRHPALRDARVRRALAHAIDRQAIVDHLRRGLARPAGGPLPPMSWAYAPEIRVFEHNPQRARDLLDEAGYPDPDGSGPRSRLQLSLKVSTNEYSRLQASVIQQDFRAVGVDLDVRTYELATLFADVFAGNFQLYTLQWAGGALADPDILRRIFHSSQRPPVGFNRGFFESAEVDRLLDEASAATGDDRRRRLFAEVQRIVTDQAVYIGLWHKTNFVIARRGLTGIRLSPTADFLFLKDVARVQADPAS